MTAPVASAQIVNLAFIIMEATPPSSLEDGSEAALAAGNHYETALHTCLEAHDWSFARRVQTMAEANHPDDQIVDPDLQYLYALPSDFLVLRHVIGDSVRWRIDGGYMHADQPVSLTIRYTARSQSEAKFPATFQTAVAYQLAHLLAPKFVGSRTKRADIMSDGAAAMDNAMRNDRVTASAESWSQDSVPCDWARRAVL